MIFAAVGTQLPFSRLMKALDGIADRHGLEIVAQTADPGFQANHLRTTAFLSPDEFDRRIAASDLVVGHAGIGLILAAKRLRKPLVLYPRRASLGEHRNEHQLATVRLLPWIHGIHVAHDDAELERLLTAGPLSAAGSDVSPSQAVLIARIRDFIAAS